jgi:effector-binding domain-containing protein
MADDHDFHAELRDVGAQQTVCARLTAPSGELPDVFRRLPVAVFERIRSTGAEPAGPLFARYHSFGAEQVDVEIGFPVAQPLPGVSPVAEIGAGEIGSSALPAGRVAFTIHRGPYDGLSDSYDRLHDWIHAAGLSEGSGPWESYVDDPGDMSDMANVRTEIVWPVG